MATFLNKTFGFQNRPRDHHEWTLHALELRMHQTSSRNSEIEAVPLSRYGHPLGVPSASPRPWPQVGRLGGRADDLRPPRRLYSLTAVRCKGSSGGKKRLRIRTGSEPDQSLVKLSPRVRATYRISKSYMLQGAHVSVAVT